VRKDVEIQVNPKHLQNVYFNMVLMWGMVLFLLWFIIFKPKPLEANLFFSLGLLAGGIPFTIFTRHFFRNSVYLTLTPESIKGYNHFKRFKGEIRWNEIVEIYSTKGTYYIILKDINGKLLRSGEPVQDDKIFTYTDEKGQEVVEETNPHNYEILMNEIIERAVNCKKIDLRSIKEKFPRITVYEKGLEK
jgi:hypothetical protein